MKRIIKGLFTLFIIAALAAVCAVSVCAEEVYPEQGDSGVGGYAEEGEVAAEESIGEDEGAVTEDSEGEGTEVNPFESFYETVLSYAGEIFCLVTLIVSLFLSYAYKRGLVPLVKGTIGALGGAVGDLRERSDRESGQIQTLSEETAKKLQLLEESLTVATDKLGELALTLAAFESDKKDRESAASVLAGQTEMLYDLLMTSALPAYQKEAIGEKMLKMKEKINEAYATSNDKRSD